MFALDDVIHSTVASINDVPAHIMVRRHGVLDSGVSGGRRTLMYPCACARPTLLSTLRATRMLAYAMPTSMLAICLNLFYEMMQKICDTAFLTHPPTHTIAPSHHHTIVNNLLLHHAYIVQNDLGREKLAVQNLVIFSHVYNVDLRVAAEV